MLSVTQVQQSLGCDASAHTFGWDFFPAVRIHARPRSPCFAASRVPARLELLVFFNLTHSTPDPLTSSPRRARSHVRGVGRPVRQYELSMNLARNRARTRVRPFAHRKHKEIQCS